MAFGKWSFTTAAALLLAGGALAEAPKLADVFGDHMVIQRDAPVTIFGEAEPGDMLMVKLDDAAKQVTAGRDGRWWAEFPALAGGSAHTITLEQNDAVVDSAGDVLAGDVFLCSGQSNMEYPLSRVNYGEREVEAASHDRLRLLQVSKVLSLTPERDLPEGDAWAVSSPDSAKDFSALCYFTGRDLMKAHDVPVGLINSSWGGSRIEPWIDGNLMRAQPQYAAQLDLLETYRDDPLAGMKAYAEMWQTAWLADPANQGAKPWEDDAAGIWKSVPGSMSDWQAWGDPELEHHYGMVWHKVSFTLTRDQAKQDATVHLGAMDDTDFTWLNGTPIGSTFSWGGNRDYEAPARLLKPGKNTLLVNVHNDWASGGMSGPDEAMKVELADGSAVSLAQGWSYQKVPSSVKVPPPAPWFTIKGYTMTHNAMIAPLAGIRLKGAMWYQGESNAGEGEAYEELLGLLMKDWRQKFGADLPVMVVQLPRFGALPVKAAEPGWGVIRESMRRATEADDKAGLVVTIDLGDTVDIHPTNKMAVAERAVRLANDLIYGEAVTGPSGPEVASVTRDGDVIRVTFEGVEEGLRTISSGTVFGFEVCMEDGMCRFANASLEGDVAEIEAEGEPVIEVRYCQGDSPLCNLFDGNGLPAGPFWAAVE